MINKIHVFKNDRYIDDSFVVVEQCDGIHDSTKLELCTCIRHGGNLSNKEAEKLAKELAEKNKVEIIISG